MRVRAMTPSDLAQAAMVHKQAFVRQKNSHEWLACTLNGFPRFMCFVIANKEELVGYIIWGQKSGFRAEAVLELEQLAVLPQAQGAGFAKRLITESLVLVKTQLSAQGSTLKHIMVTTRADNFAQKLYESTLGAKVDTTICDLYSADEVLMIARNIGKR